MQRLVRRSDLKTGFTMKEGHVEAAKQGIENGTAIQYWLMVHGDLHQLALWIQRY